MIPYIYITLSAIVILNISICDFHFFSSSKPRLRLNSTLFELIKVYLTKSICTVIKRTEICKHNSLDTRSREPRKYFSHVAL